MVNPLFNAMQVKNTETSNGAITNNTSQDNLLDLFFLAGACRRETEENIRRVLERAFGQDPLKTIKIIFWAGDIREGAGERRFFRIALKWLEDNYRETSDKLVKLVPVFNRWDSLFHLKSDEVNELVSFNLFTNAAEIQEMTSKEFSKTFNQSKGLLAKWLPRKYNKEFKNFRIAFQKKYKLNDAAYRKLIVSASKTVEQQMSAKEWDKINYEHVPSVASNKYRKAFFKHDEVRFKEYIDAVTKGEKKINASAIFPHDIYKALKRGDNAEAVDAQWSSLPNYLEGSTEKILPLCDVSGSMDSLNGLPIAISIALGIYFSERNNSIFKDGFLTFTRQPELQILTGTFSQRVRQFNRSYAENTNLISAFELILDKAKENGISQEGMPTTLLVISDMEFDASCDGNKKTNYEKIGELYRQSGYTLPKVVFWNVSGRAGNIPITKNDRAVLVSGASPAVIKAVLGGEADPVKVMENAINNDRYKLVERTLI